MDGSTIAGKLVISDNVTSISAAAFQSCDGLTSVIIPNSVTSVDSYAFQVCFNLTSVTIENGVTSIGYMAFYWCPGLTEITIPSSVTSIGDLAFLECTGLTEINVDTNNPNYSSDNGVLYNKDKTTLIKYLEGKTGDSFTIPDSVTSIGDYAFEMCRSLTSVNIPDSVTSIGDYAFSACTGLTSVTIPNSVTSIGDYAFDMCHSLTSVNIPDSVTSIGDYVFCSCESLTEINVDANNPNYSSDNGVLYNKNKTILILCPEGKIGSYTIPDIVTSIGEHAFRFCRSLTEVNIPSSVTSIGIDAFSCCESLTATILGGNVDVGDRAFLYVPTVYYAGYAEGIDYSSWEAGQVLPLPSGT